MIQIKKKQDNIWGKNCFFIGILRVTEEENDRKTHRIKHSPRNSPKNKHGAK